MAQYVNNAQMLAEYKVWKDKYETSKALGETSPPIPHYLATCILKISEKLANRYNFNGYSFRDDMTGDAILECVKYFHCFDPAKSDSIFAYFSRVAFQSFVGRINRERKQTYIKGKIVQQMDPSEFMEGTSPDIDNNIDAYRSAFNIDTAPYERQLERKRKKREVTIDDFADVEIPPEALAEDTLPIEV